MAIQPPVAAPPLISALPSTRRRMLRTSAAPTPSWGSIVPAAPPSAAVRSNRTVSPPVRAEKRHEPSAANAAGRPTDPCSAKPPAPNVSSGRPSAGASATSAGTRSQSLPRIDRVTATATPASSCMIAAGVAGAESKRRVATPPAPKFGSTLP